MAMQISKENDASLPASSFQAIAVIFSIDHCAKPQR
jgi:hypothetical protein